MDTSNGRIYTPEQLAQMDKEILRRMQLMAVPPTEVQMARHPPKVGRNEPCPCGSGKKFKKCCLQAAPAPGREHEK